ncbi:MAG: histidinol-phosphate transaminase [Terriglobales bacterium]
MLKPTEAVCRVKAYHPPLGGRCGLRLDFNENTAGCSPRVLARLRQITADDLSRYPEREPVEAVAAESLGLLPSQALLTNGVDEAIHLLCEAYLQPGDEALTVVPTFAMYELAASATGANVRTVTAGENFRFPAAQLLARISPRTRLIAIANPNNPTGAIAEGPDLLAIADRAPHAAVLVDEAYFDFYGETLIGHVASHSNLFVARTFSKAYGLAGLRVGVLAGPEEQMVFLRRIASPYNVNAVALACLPEALSDREYVRAYVEQVRRGRARLEAALRSLLIPCWTSQANFVLARFAERRQAFVAGMRLRGILVRDRDSDPGCAGCVRITVGTDEQNERLICALQDCLAEGARAREVPA